MKTSAWHSIKQPVHHNNTECTQSLTPSARASGKRNFPPRAGGLLVQHGPHASKLRNR